MEEGIQTRECSCGKTERRGIPKTDHAWGTGKVTVQATTKREGVMEWRCSVCGMTRTSPIPKLTSGTSDASAPNPAAPPPEDTTSSPVSEVTKASETLPDKAADTDDKGGESSDKNEANSDESEKNSDESEKNSDRGEKNTDMSEKNSDKGGKNGFDKDTVDQDALQKQEKGSASEGTAARSFSVVKILLLALVPVLLITAGVILLLVRRKKTGWP